MTATAPAPAHARANKQQPTPHNADGLPPAELVVMPTTYSIKTTRGMKGAYGFEIEVHHARSVEEAVAAIRSMHWSLKQNLPELDRVE